MQIVFSNTATTISELAEKRWYEYSEHLDATLIDNARDEFKRSVPLVWTSSEFVQTVSRQYPNWLPDSIAEGTLFRDITEPEIDVLLDEACADCDDETSLMQQLRRIRRCICARITWRDISGWATIEQTLLELSWLADACIQTALTWSEKTATERFGNPKDAGGRTQRLVVLGMGKLGGHELNFSSDVDLIFAYPQRGHTDGAKSISNEEFFTRVSKTLIRVLDTTTADGFVYRVDTRLRPFGDSGALVLDFDKTLAYYEQHGRDWERYALIKARIVAGDVVEGTRLFQALQPFVFRRYLDYNAIDGMRRMKSSIETEVRRKGLKNNVKLGAGGIREIEFVTQVFQMIRGGHEPALQRRRLLPTLAYLGESGALSIDTTDQLADNYRFLRRLENRLQQFREEQAHNLPEQTADRERLAYSMLYNDWKALEDEINKHRKHVRTQFNLVFSNTDEQEKDDGLEMQWLTRDALEPVEEFLDDHHYEACEKTAELLHDLRQGRVYERLTERGRELFDRLIPAVVELAGESDAPDVAVARVCKVIEAVGQRTTYLALLVENRHALSRLVTICAASPWITHYIGQHPMLLDDLLDDRNKSSASHQERLKTELKQLIEEIPEQDLEQQMEALRHFKQTEVLRVAMADVINGLPLARVSDHLTEIAEELVQCVLKLAWREMTTRYGIPQCIDSGEARYAGFAVIAYGKLGGLELGYSSDLDLVFLHDSRGEKKQTNGEKTIENPVFFARLAQRIVHILSTQTHGGRVYEVDIRLRPSGRSGLMVSNTESFRQYQADQAWTWEHQALARARAVAGDTNVIQEFNETRADTLAQKRDPKKLADEVIEMRDKMRANLDKSTDEQFDLKQGPGGITDIEFMVQYAVLRWGVEHAALLRYTDNLRILEALGSAQLISGEDTKILTNAYLDYRARGHKLALQELAALVPDAEFSPERRAVQRIWLQLFEQD